MPQPRSPLGSSFAILYPRHRDVSLRNRVARSLGFHPGQRFHRQCFNQKPLHPTCLHYYLPPVACKTLPGLHMAFVVRELPGRKPHTLPCNTCAWDKLQVFITRAKMGTCYLGSSRSLSPRTGAFTQTRRTRRQNARSSS